MDDYSRLSWPFIMKNKSNVNSILMEFVNEIKNQFGTVIKIIQSDNERKFLSD